MRGVPRGGVVFPIDDRVPLPKRGRPVKYPLANLDVGQSFFIPTTSREEARKIRSRLANAVYLFEKQTSGQRQFTLRTTSDGVRVWRIAYSDFRASPVIFYDRPDIAANPKQIAKIEICCLDDARAEVRIYSDFN